MPFELHPEFPDGGGIENTRRFSQIAPLAEAEGIPFRPPSRFRPTRKAHQMGLLVQHLDPANAEMIHDRLFAAYWDSELDTEDSDVLATLMADTEVDQTMVAETLATDALLPALGTSMMRANEWGVSGTPAHVVANALHVPGLQEDEFWDRVITRIQERTGEG